MKFVRTESFKKDYAQLPRITQRKLDQKLRLLSTNLRHPGIRAKKIQKAKDIWEGRVDRFHRFTFQIEEDKIVLRRVGGHDIIGKEQFS